MCPTVNETRIDNDNWIKCVYCGHKLGKVLHNAEHEDCIVEIKCHSCKTINLCHLKMNEILDAVETCERIEKEKKNEP